jgi:hypothetical protein
VPSPCGGFVELAGASYCSTTIGAVLAGELPVGSRVVVPQAWVLESTASLIVVGRDECPSGSYCGGTLVTVAVTIPTGVVSPPVDALVDVFGTVTPENAIAAIGFGGL